MRKAGRGVSRKEASKHHNIMPLPFVVCEKVGENSAFFSDERYAIWINDVTMSDKEPCDSSDLLCCNDQ